MLVTLSDPTPWDKPSQGVTLATPQREGEVRVWASGECEVVVGDVASGDPDQVHHDLTSNEEFVALLDAFRAQFLASAA